MTIQGGSKIRRGCTWLIVPHFAPKRNNPASHVFVTKIIFSVRLPPQHHSASQLHRACSTVPYRTAPQPAAPAYPLPANSMPIAKLLMSVSKSKAIGLSFASATAATTVFYTMLQSTGMLGFVGCFAANKRERAEGAARVCRPARSVPLLLALYLSSVVMVVYGDQGHW